MENQVKKKKKIFFYPEPKIDIKIKTTRFSVGRRKLKYKWTLEMQKDLEIIGNTDVEQMLVDEYARDFFK